MASENLVILIERTNVYRSLFAGRRCQTFELFEVYGYEARMGTYVASFYAGIVRGCGAQTGASR